MVYDTENCIDYAEKGIWYKLVVYYAEKGKWCKGEYTTPIGPPGLRGRKVVCNSMHYPVGNKL